MKRIYVLLAISTALMVVVSGYDRKDESYEQWLQSDTRGKEVSAQWEKEATAYANKQVEYLHEDYLYKKRHRYYKVKEEWEQEAEELEYFEKYFEQRYKLRKKEYKHKWETLHYTMWPRIRDKAKDKAGARVQGHADDKIDEAFDAIEKHLLPEKIPEKIVDGITKIFTPAKDRTNPYVVLIQNELPGIVVEYKGFSAFKGEENGFEHEKSQDDEVTRYDLIQQHEYATVKVNAHSGFFNRGTAGILRFHLYDAAKTYFKVLHIYVENSKSFLGLFGETRRTCAVTTDYTSEWEKEGTGEFKFQDEESCTEEANLRWAKQIGHDVSIFMHSYDYEDINKKKDDMKKIRYARVILAEKKIVNFKDPLKHRSRENKEEFSNAEKLKSQKGQRNGNDYRQGQNSKNFFQNDQYNDYQGREYKGQKSKHVKFQSDHYQDQEDYEDLYNMFKQQRQRP